MDQDPPDVAGALISALAEQGEYVDEGAFTLDFDKAREKLGEFQLEDPAAYVLLLVEAAWLAGHAGLRSDIRFELGATTRVTMASLDLDDGIGGLSNVLGAVFRKTSGLEGEELLRARTLQSLGLAINAALALEPEAVVVEHVDASGRRATLRFGPSGPDEVERGTGEVPSQTRFELRGASLDLLRPRRERELLHARARFASFPVHVGGQRLSAGTLTALGPPEHRTNPIVEVETTNPRRIVGAATRIDSIEQNPAKLLLLTRGVLSETINLPNLAPGFMAAVDVDLRKDLSQRRVRRDAALERLFAAVNRAHAQLPAPPQRVDPPDENESGVNREALKVLAPFLVISLVIGLVGLLDEPDPTWSEIDLEGFEFTLDDDDFEAIKRKARLCSTHDEQACDAATRSELAFPKGLERRVLDGLTSWCAAGIRPACMRLAQAQPWTNSPLIPGERWRGERWCGESKQPRVELDIDAEDSTLGELRVELLDGDLYETQVDVRYYGQPDHVVFRPLSFDFDPDPDRARVQPVRFSADLVVGPEGTRLVGSFSKDDDCAIFELLPSE